MLHLRTTIMLSLHAYLAQSWWKMFVVVCIGNRYSSHYVGTILHAVLNIVPPVSKHILVPID